MNNYYIMYHMYNNNLGILSKFKRFEKNFNYLKAVECISKEFKENHFNCG